MLATPLRRAMTAEPSMQPVVLNRGQHGFTVMELVTVMIVISILAVVALPRLSVLSGFDEVGFRDQAKSTLEFARKAAIAQRRYSCVARTGNTLALSIDVSSPEGRSTALCPREQNLAQPGSGSNTISPRGNTTLLGTSAAAVVFDAQGRPWTAASAAVSTTAQFTVHGNADSVITVEAETGYVH